MKVELPRNINIIKSAELEDYFVFYAFNRSDHLFLYLTDKSLNLIEEIEIHEKGYFSSDFHGIKTNELLFSVTISSTSDRLPETKAYYQYFETKWYKLKVLTKDIIIKNAEVELKELEYWKRSEIKNIRSKTINNKIFWISDLQSIKIENGRYKKSWSFQFAVTNTFDELPKFKHIDIRYSSIKTIDFHVEDEIFYVAAICNTSWDTPVVFSYKTLTEQIQKEELKIKIRRLHHFHEVRIVNHHDKLILYFNSTSHEFSKKYEFRIYKSITPKAFDNNSELSYLNELDYIRNVKWYEHKGKTYSSYAPIKGSKVVRITKVMADKEKLIDEIEDINTVMISNSNELIYSCVRGEPLKKTYLVKQKMKNYD